MTTSTLTWWVFLCVVSSLNVLAWTASVATLKRRQHLYQAEIWALMRLQMLLSAGYVLGCAYRSVFPVYDVQRLVLFDSWLSSVIVGRSVATFAELCFAAQWALFLRGMAQVTGSAGGVRVSRLIVPMIVVAEVCSWYAVLTTSNLGHVLEESIWGLSALLLVTSFASVWPRCNRELRTLLAGACVIGLAYVIYMFQVDVPMYWARWTLDEHHGRPYFSVAQGLTDAAGRWVVSHQWADWESEIVWMSLYFSVAVWLSIGLMHVPPRFGLQRVPVLDRHAGYRATVGVTRGGKPLHS